MIFWCRRLRAKILIGWVKLFCQNDHRCQQCRVMTTSFDWSAICRLILLLFAFKRCYGVKTSTKDDVRQFRSVSAKFPTSDPTPRCSSVVACKFIIVKKHISWDLDWVEWYKFIFELQYIYQIIFVVTFKDFKCHHSIVFLCTGILNWIIQLIQIFLSLISNW